MSPGPALSQYMKEETGHYIINAHLTARPRETRRFLAVFELDEYQGWGEYHCTFLGGAMALKLKPEGKHWNSKDPRWAVEKVEMISRARYLKELEAICR